MSKVENESVRLAMDQAWRDHHHARDQTWKTIQIVAVITAGLLTIDYQYKEVIPTLFAGILTIISAMFGVLITWNHRKLERRKFIHIMNCEEYLGLHKDYLIPLSSDEKLVDSKNKTKEYNDEIISKLLKDSAVRVPKMFSFFDIFNLFKNSTALFILRMHVAIIFFSILVIVLRTF